MRLKLAKIWLLLVISVTVAIFVGRIWRLAARFDDYGDWQIWVALVGTFACSLACLAIELIEFFGSSPEASKAKDSGK
jgi:hypothetical protein